MKGVRHLIHFVALGLFWGASPSFYGYWGQAGVPASHVIGYTGIGLALALAAANAMARGGWGETRSLMRYGFICAFLMNMPFAWSITLGLHVPPPELALVFSTSPIVNFALGVAMGRDRASLRRVLAILLGFAASAILVVSRQHVSGGFSWWLVAAFINPFLWAAYNGYAQSQWPRGAGTFAVGAAESFWSAMLAMPFLFFVSPPWSTTYHGDWAVLSLLCATVMWTVERISFFTLIREKGASYTSQAIYLSAPAAVLIAVIFFGGASDAWLWASLALVMAALYFNNSGSRRVGNSLGSEA
ncbi:MAG: DMT family transporter [Hyphomicrobiales bacterium]